MKYNRITKFVVTTSLATGLFAVSPIFQADEAHASAPAGNSTASAETTTEVQVSTVLRTGDRGSGVSELQSELASLGYYNYNVDGVFGPITEEAVRSFQSSQSLTVDGIAGPNTFGALPNVEAVQSETTETTETEETASASSSNSSGLVGTAESLIGTPYVWGGTTPSGFDCSGFLNYVFEQNGQSLPRTTQAIYDAGTPVSSPSVGDIVFFQNTYNTASLATHAGIYIGGNQFIHASSSGVRVDNLNSDYYQNHFLGYRSM